MSNILKAISSFKNKRSKPIDYYINYNKFIIRDYCNNNRKAHAPSSGIKTFRNNSYIGRGLQFNSVSISSPIYYQYETKKIYNFNKAEFIYLINDHNKALSSF